MSEIISITFLSAALVYLSFSVILAETDYRTGLLPDKLTLSLLWLGLLFHAITQPDKLDNAIYGAVSGYLSLWLLYWGFFWFSKKEGLGYGDFKLLAAIGAWNGWQSLPVVLVIASVLGIIAFVVRHISQRNRTGQLPFGPYLVIAGWGEFICPV